VLNLAKWFLITSQESRQVIDRFDATPSRAILLTAVIFSKSVCEINRAKVKSTELRLQFWIKKIHNHFTHRSHRDEHNKSMSRTIKIITLEYYCIKKICVQAPRHFDELKTELTSPPCMILRCFI